MTVPPQNSARRFAVIGGGITGLAAAHRLIELGLTSGHPADITLFEASDRIGGVAGTERIGGYLVETGADSFITNKPGAIRLCERLGLAERLLKTVPQFRGSQVLRKGKPVSVPDGFMLLSPAKIWPVLKSSIFSPLGKLRMGLEYFVPRRTEEGDESLADFVRRRLGREALDRLIQPLVGGIYTSDPERLSLRATLPRFVEMEREYGSLIRAARRQLAGPSSQPEEASGGGARYSLFATLTDGMTELFDTLRATIETGGRIAMNSPVVRLESLGNGRTRLTFADQSTADFDGVIIALPAYRAAELLTTLTSYSELSSALGAIEYASTAVVVSGHKLDDIENPLNSFGLVIPAIERRRILAVSYASRKFVGRAPEGRVILRTFVGGAMQPEQLLGTDAEIERSVLDELRSVLGVGGTPDFLRVVRHTKSMPQYTIGHLDRVRRIFELMTTVQGIELAGNAYHGVGLPDSIESAERAAERIW